MLYAYTYGKLTDRLVLAARTRASSVCGMSLISPSVRMSSTWYFCCSALQFDAAAAAAAASMRGANRVGPDRATLASASRYACMMT